ncbi:signal recognition particle-docking protein FtsY [Agaribacter marinus]|uniref:Signal recognition particle receptor FtsY n=1 Tax=Agaribacter marinus TaxID=1431249 RepID=A0AA37T5C4_9ALTE|nr:signal recognition particle-docking protein FtsY [Agaribacter marinus]GLR72368.1 hypothetical protein GCM10007852_32760 [Agaribacter marinus]
MFSWFKKDSESKKSDTPQSPKSEIIEQTNSDIATGDNEKGTHDANNRSAEIAKDKSANTSVESETTAPSPEKHLADTGADIADERSDAGETGNISEPADTDANTENDLPNNAAKKAGFFSRLKERLSKTRENIGSGFVALLKGKTIDDDLYEELETQLLIADVGMKTTQKLIGNLTQEAKISQLKDGDALASLLKQQLSSIIKPVNIPLDLNVLDENGQKCPFVILMVGVNGVGKTTTIGKLAKQFQQEGKSVMLAAGDTFRAAAVEQLEVWGERNDIPVVSQFTGADSASVIFDAVASAKAKNIDVLIADTAGRLQNKDNLIEELKKVVRVMKKQMPDAPHEIMLTLDASTGQNAVSQTKIFNEAVGVTGINVTKLDGTAKGGVIFALADEFSIPVRYIGIGEGIDDLRPFDADDFVEALFD